MLYTMGVLDPVYYRGSFLSDFGAKALSFTAKGVKQLMRAIIRF
jgi:hypothetical protein